MKKWFLRLAVVVLALLVFSAAPALAVGEDPEDGGHRIPVLRTDPGGDSTAVRPDTGISITLDTRSKAFREYREELERGRFVVIVEGDGRKAGYVGSGKRVEEGAPGRENVDDGLRVPRAGVAAYDLGSGTVSVVPGTLERYTRYTVTLALKDNYERAIHDQGLKERADLVAFQFTTGSAIGEPTHLQVQVPNGSPRVTDGGLVTVVATDDYGGLATLGRMAVSARRADGSAPSSSFGASPVELAFSESQRGKVNVGLTDHEVETLYLTAGITGPWPGDSHLETVGVAWQPGPPASATLTLAAEAIVGHNQRVSGEVTDVYGNAVLDGEALALSTSEGDIESSVTTTAGHYAATYAAPTKLVGAPGKGDQVTVGLSSHNGTARAAAQVLVRPGAPHSLLLDLSPTTLAADGTSQATVSGDATDAFGNAVVDGTEVTLLADDEGSVAPSLVQTASGRFAASYTAGVTPGDVVVTATTGQVVAATRVTLRNPIPAGATLDLVPKLDPDGSYTLTGKLLDAAGEPLAGVPLRLDVSSGAASAVVATTDANGQFVFQYQPPADKGNATIMVGAYGTTLGALGIEPLIDGNQPFTDTGIDVEAGQAVTISARGSWADRLLGRIGSGNGFRVGANLAFVAGAGGRLYLGPGDTRQVGNVDSVICVGGHSGAVTTVEVAVDPASLPADGASTAAIAGRLRAGLQPVPGAVVNLTLTGSGGFQTGPNLVPNPSVEADLAGVIATGNDARSLALFRTGEAAKDGSHSLKAVASVQGDCNATWQQASGPDNTSGIPVTGGGTYTFSTHIKIPAPLAGADPTVRIRVIEWTSDGTLVRDDGAAPTGTHDGLATDWVGLYQTLTLQPSTARVSFRVYIHGAGTVYVDGVKVEPGPYATPLAVSAAQVTTDRDGRFTATYLAGTVAGTTQLTASYRTLRQSAAIVLTTGPNTPPMEAPTGTNLGLMQSNGTASATSSYRGCPASNAFDGRLDTMWNAGTWSPGTLTRSWLQPVRVSGFTLFVSGRATQSVTFSVEGSKDGSNWEAVTGTRTLFPGPAEIVGTDGSGTPIIRISTALPSPAAFLQLRLNIDLSADWTNALEWEILGP